MSVKIRFPRLDHILLADAATCTAMGVVLAASPGLIGGLTGIPRGLLFWAGLGLIPVAAYMALIASRYIDWPAAVGLVIAGNAVWVVGSLALFTIVNPSAFGAAFILGQAAVVIVFSLLEYAGFRTTFRDGWLPG